MIPNEQMLRSSAEELLRIAEQESKKIPTTTRFPEKERFRNRRKEKLIPLLKPITPSTQWAHDSIILKPNSEEDSNL